MATPLNDEKVSKDKRELLCKMMKSKKLEKYLWPNSLLNGKESERKILISYLKNL